MKKKTDKICKRCGKPLYCLDISYEEAKKLYDANVRYNAAISMADPRKLYKDHSLNESELYGYFKAANETLLETLSELNKLKYEIIDKYTTNPTARIIYDEDLSKYQIEQCGE
jgi:hypothetical protein